MKKKNEILQGLGWLVKFDNNTKYHIATKGAFTLQEKSLSILFSNAIRVI